MLTITVQTEHSDTALVAFNKPSGLLTVPGRGEDKQDCLFRRIHERHSDALVVHRLDRDTSGLVLFARSPQAQRHLGSQFAARMVDKIYIAVVAGVIRQNSGLVDYPLRKDTAQPLPPRHLVDCIRGSRAVTQWRVLERGTASTRLELRPLTGRSHQLRVHMLSLGYPIVGDPIYGRPAARLMLHAARLVFAHPATGEPIALESPVPF